MYISNIRTRNTNGQSNKKPATDTQSEEVVYEAELGPQKLSMASRNLRRGQGYNQPGSHLSQRYIEMLEYDELEIVDHEHGAPVWPIPYDGTVSTALSC